MSNQAVGQTEFYQKHLDQVSRSFAFCIRQLREPFRARVGLAYLLCRILDTVEDSSYTDARVRFKQIEEFNDFMSRLPTEKRVAKWLELLPPTLKVAERELMNDVRVILEDFHSLEESEKRILRDTVLSMSNGMVYFLHRSSGSGDLRLRSVTEVNRYCFFVAGVVGEMLSRLVALHNPKFKLTPQLLLRAHQFGLFLQKINLLKDQLEDEQVGRHLVPSQDDLWESLERDMQGAFDYLVAIPIEEREYRLFCGWSLFLGLGSVPWIRRAWARKVMDKIPRPVTEKILAEVTERIDDNIRLRGLFERTRPAIERSRRKTVVSGDDFPDFTTLYLGSVSRDHMHRLGMIGKEHLI